MPHTRNVETPSDAHDAKYRNWQPLDSTHDNAFTDLIQRDPVVCDNCFLKRYTRVTKEWWRGSLGWMDYERWIPYPEHATEVPADSTAAGTRLACSNCGFRRDKQRPVPKQLIREYAENISETLDAKAIEHDRDVLLSMVEQYNTSANQGRQDTHVFAPAVDDAIRAAHE